MRSALLTAITIALILLGATRAQHQEILDDNRSQASDYLDEDLMRNSDILHVTPKRSGFLSHWYKRQFRKRWPICTTYTKSCNISPRSCCEGLTCMGNLWGQNCRCQRQGVISQ